MVTLYGCNDAQGCVASDNITIEVVNNIENLMVSDDGSLGKPVGILFFIILVIDRFEQSSHYISY